MFPTNPTEISHFLGVIMMLFALKIDFITQAMNSEYWTLNRLLYLITF